LRIKKTKNKVSYSFICQNNNHKIIEHLGKTDNPCRTTITHWITFKNYPNKHISFDVDMSSKFYQFDYNLKLIEKNYNKTYKYNNETINRERFILLLGCETKRQEKNSL